MTIEKNNWNRWKKTAGSFDMEEIQMALRNYNTREENEMQEQKQLQDLEKEMEKYPQICVVSTYSYFPFRTESAILVLTSWASFGSVRSLG